MLGWEKERKKKEKNMEDILLRIIKIQVNRPEIKELNLTDMESSVVTPCSFFLPAGIFHIPKISNFFSLKKTLM